MYQKIVLHVKLKDGASKVELDELLSEAVCAYGGKVIEIEDYQMSCYNEEDC